MPTETAAGGETQTGSQTAQTQATGTTTQAGSQGAQGQGQGQGQSAETQAAAQTFETFEQYVAAQPDAVKDLLEDHTHGLKQALENERKGRRELEKQLKALSGKTEEGSELRKALEEMNGKFAEANKRADFYDEAGKNDALPARVKALYTLANTEGHVDDRGRVSWSDLKSAYPEFFAKAPAAAGAQAQKPAAAARANAGAGTTEGGGAKAASMNDLIRRGAGRQ